MIKKVEVQWSENSPLTTYKFDEKLNIFTGKNGSGKTTLLKTLWYTLSNNFVQIFKEINFKSFKIYKEDGVYYYLEFIAEKRDLKIKLDNQNLTNVDEFTEKKLKIEFGNESLAVGIDFFIDEVHKLDEFNKFLFDYHNHLDFSESSLFFPTFRRIEGGYDIEYSKKYSTINLKDNLDEISKYLSNEKHSFITSVSKDDIETLVSKKYAEISYKKNFDTNISYQKIFKIINENKKKEIIEEDINEFEKILKKLLKENKSKLYPFEILDNSVKRMLKRKHIKLGKMSLGDLNENPIHSKDLSAGEKQILGFLCYNFFYDNTIIFIDEPELSLHVDWQRTMFQTLLRQKNNNQFIISTHSPFIYSRFPENEIIINKDKGE